MARARPIDAVLARLSALGVDAGRVLSASRETPAGRLQWRIAVRDDGALLHHGALPTLIEWGHTHPAAAMFPVGVQLRRLVLRGLSQPVWSALALSSVAEPPERDDPRAHGLSAVLDTPRGRLTLHSA